MPTPSAATVAVVDYQLNNLASICRALNEAGASRVETLTMPEKLDAFSHVVLPGVGAFDAAMANLKAAGWVEALRERCGEEGTPLLGVCLGMQLLAECSEEGDPGPGISLIPGEVVRLTATPRERVPHVGWNTVRPKAGSSLFAGVDDHLDFYFVHSFTFRPHSTEAVEAQTPFGEGVITAAVRQGNVLGVQFHPEKSSWPGVALLRNFLSGAGEHA